MNNRLILLLCVLTACTSTPSYQTIGTFERYDAALDDVVQPGAKAEIIAEGHDWSEGPVWVGELQALLYSDVPRNTIYQWSEKGGVQEYLKPSGYTGAGNYSGEPGSNGLLLDEQGLLLLCQHGDRRVALMDAELNEPQPVFTSVADRFRGRKFNSPNDAAIDREGNLYFTDPPYGLPEQATDSTRELNFQGVYKVDTNGKVYLLVDSLTRPNGIALSPDQRTLYVANSDPDRARWYRYTLGDTAVVAGEIFYDGTAESKAGAPGLPDGFKVDRNGNLYASGPGGVSIFNATGQRLGLLRLDAPTSNTALSADEKTLYITNDMYVLRVRLRD